MTGQLFAALFRLRGRQFKPRVVKVASAAPLDDVHARLAKLEAPTSGARHRYAQLG